MSKEELQVQQIKAETRQNNVGYSCNEGSNGHLLHSCIPFSQYQQDQTEGMEHGRIRRNPFIILPSYLLRLILFFKWNERKG